jgi:hypothetical protein
MALMASVPHLVGAALIAGLFLGNHLLQTAHLTLRASRFR